MGIFDKLKSKVQDIRGSNGIDAVTGATVNLQDTGNVVDGINNTDINVPSGAGEITSEKNIETRVDSLKTEAGLAYEYNLTSNQCFRVAVNKKYKELDEQTDKESFGDKIVDLRGSFDVNKTHPVAAKIVYNRDPEFVKAALTSCLRSQGASSKLATVDQTSKSQDIKDAEDGALGPFDRRLYRDFTSSNNETTTRIPFSIQYQETATSGLLIGEALIQESNLESKEKGIKQIQEERKRLQHDSLYIGVPALQNTYALTKLYGSEGGAKLMNQRGERRWYEVDQAFGTGSTDLANFASNPTTSSLISWGNGDPYGRTPYHFTDFVFSKYWNKVENNRLITLRRFGAPILDNLKFPGMDGVTKLGNPGSETYKGTTDSGSTSRILFPPMAHAVTYFGEETGNNLNDILKFTTGLRWDDVKSDVWEVRAESTPDNEAGPGVFKSLAGLSKMLAIAGGNFDPQLIMNQGNLPPDPYKEGPYENRILGPVNRIDSVKRRIAGLDFEWSGLNLQFEYVARPVGGVNPKAVLLDIMSNFLIIGSASAVFFGGQHRFMSNPAKYPFLGGEKGIEAWYSGKPLQWAGHTVDAFVGQVTNEDDGIAKGAQGFFDQLLGKTGEGGIKGIFGAVKGLFTGEGPGANLIKGKLAEKSAGQVPYLQGMKALLTGEPVGEWHVTIGNPLNPIAMIGNLICTGIEIEFGNELGPDDFPTEIKITVKLDHGMPRDRDAIQSIFNRGMGRIYDLPDKFEGTADGQTKVDNYTANANETGTAASIRGWLAGPSKLGGRSGPPVINETSNQGETSVWARAPFAAVSPNESIINSEGDIARSGYRAVDWVALKSLK